MHDKSVLRISPAWDAPAEAPCPALQNKQRPLEKQGPG